MSLGRRKIITGASGFDGYFNPQGASLVPARDLDTSVQYGDYLIQPIDDYGAFIRPDGLAFYTFVQQVSSGDYGMVQVPLSIKNDLTSGVWASIVFKTAAAINNGSGTWGQSQSDVFDIAHDGSTVISTDTSGFDGIAQAEFGTPWDISTLTSSGVTFDTSSIAVNMDNSAWGAGGNTVLQIDAFDVSDTFLYQFDTSTPYSLAGATLTGYKTLAINSITGDIGYKEVKMTQDGNYLYVISTDWLRRIRLLTPGDITTATAVGMKSYSVSALYPSSYTGMISISGDGIWAFLPGRPNSKVYALSTG